jgi:hypothetical protein
MESRVNVINKSNRVLVSSSCPMIYIGFEIIYLRLGEAQIKKLIKMDGPLLLT